MGVQLVENVPTMHTFRSVRRALAINRQRCVLHQNKLELGHLRSQISSWELWWTSWAGTQPNTTRAVDDQSSSIEALEHSHLRVPPILSFNAQGVRKSIREPISLQESLATPKTFREKENVIDEGDEEDTPAFTHQQWHLIIDMAVDQYGAQLHLQEHAAAAIAPISKLPTLL